MPAAAAATATTHIIIWGFKQGQSTHGTDVIQSNL